MNWKKPSSTVHPPVKHIVLGLQFPNAVELVKLDRIDETGPVFQKIGRTALSDFADIFSSTVVTDIERNVVQQVKIDMYCEIEIPKE